MLGLFGRTRPKTSRPAPRQARLRLESLESRDVPSTVSLSVSDGNNHVPSAVALSVSYGNNRSVTLSGTLSDHPNPSMQQIDLGGKVNGIAITNQQGQFSVTLEASALGAVTATAHDGSSNTAQLTLADVTPTLTFDACEGMNHVWTLEGHVTYAGRSLDGVQVFFGGAPATLQIGLPCDVHSDGEYAMTVTLNGTTSDNGTATAKVLTPWGTWSSPAYASILQTGT